MKKISKLLIGTNNIGKYKEIRDLLPKYINTYSTFDFKLKSPKEDGLTFTENSIIKSNEKEVEGPGPGIGALGAVHLS